MHKLLCLFVLAGVATAQIGTPQPADLPPELRAASDLLESGELIQAEQTLEKFLASRTAGLGSDPHFATAVSDRARILVLLGRHEDAERSYLLALRLLERMGPSRDAERVTVLADLASLYVLYSQPGRASRLLDRASVICAGPSLNQTPDCLRLRVEYASLLMARKDFATAESLLRDLLSILDRQSVVQPLKVPALNYLAFLLAERNRLPEAETIARESFELATHLIGPNHVFTAHPLFVLAGIEAQLGRPHDSDRHFNQALAIYASSYGTRHPMYAKALREFSDALRKANRKEDSKRLQIQAQSIATGKSSSPGLTPGVIDVSDLHARSRR